MKRWMIKCAWLVMLCITLTGCPRQKQVWFGELWQTHVADAGQAGLTRIYIDKYGEVYPPFFVTYKEFFDPDNTGSTEPYKDSMRGSLRYCFTSDPERMKKLVSAVPGIPQDISPDQQFNQIQDKMLEQYAIKINRESGGTNKELAIFIHGFNDPNPTGSYQELRDHISRLKPNLTYVEIYWDGLTANNGNPGTEHIWGWAQRNSAYVSLTVRALIIKLSSDTKIRILTHSLGASVATGALFNTTHKWKKSTWDYLKLVTTIPAPKQKDIRLGMIAPAVPGTSTFGDFNERNPEITPSQNNISRIVIGHNKNDYALTKTLFAKKQRLAGVFGATTLGCNYRGKEISLVREKLIEIKYTKAEADALILEEDFSEKTAGTLEEHGLHYYLLNKNMGSFLGKLFN